MNGIKLLSTGSAVPSRVVTNDDLAKIVDTNDEWISTRTGIRSRRHCGEGGSGGALALGVGNRVLMLENAVYSVLSPEGFAAILWKDASRADEACGVMKLTAADLLELGVADKVIPEPEGGAQADPETLYKTLDTVLARELTSLSKLSGAALAAGRYKKFRAMGAKALRKERT